MKRQNKTPISNQNPPHSNSSARASGLREVEEARALLRDQLHSAYWWIFNSCRIKGFVRAKGLDKAATEGETLPAEPAQVGETEAPAKK